jgi:hypothetical protein
VNVFVSGSNNGNNDNVVPIKRGGTGGGDMDIERRLTGIETAQIQLGMDMQYMKGRMEDMPTKDFIHSKIAVYFGGIAALITIGIAIITAMLQR